MKLLIVICLCLILLILSILFFTRAVQNKIDNTALEQSKESLIEDIKTLKDLEQNLNMLIKEKREDYQKELSNIKENIEEQKQAFQLNADYGFSQYSQSLEQKYQQVEEDFDKSIEEIKKEQEKEQLILDKIKSTVEASIKARLREKEVEEQEKFYTLQMNEQDLYEIDIIKSIEHKLSQPRPLRMLIWTTYYSKKANDLCSRILGKEKVTGIYKITNISSKECYVGQAKDVKSRLRDHMKCGLGIDAPAGNLLYKAMKTEGLESFSFELLEQCPSDELNEKERFYIDLYNSYDFGYNSNRGIKE